MDPVHQVGTGSMRPHAHLLHLVCVEQVVPPFPIDAPLRIERVADTFRGNEMVRRPVRILLVLLAQLSRLWNKARQSLDLPRNAFIIRRQLGHSSEISDPSIQR